MLRAKEYSSSKLDTVPAFRECLVREETCELCYEKISGTMTDFSMESDLGCDWLVLLENF